MSVRSFICSEAPTDNPRPGKLVKQPGKTETVNKAPIFRLPRGYLLRELDLMKVSERPSGALTNEPRGSQSCRRSQLGGPQVATWVQVIFWTLLDKRRLWAMLLPLCPGEVHFLLC